MKLTEKREYKDLRALQRAIDLHKKLHKCNDDCETVQKLKNQLEKLERESK